MSKRNKAARLQAAASNVQTTGAFARPPAEPNAPTVEKTMEAPQEDISQTPTPETPSPSIEVAATAKPEPESISDQPVVVSDEPLRIVEVTSAVAPVVDAAPDPVFTSLAKAEEENAARVIAQAKRNAELAEQAAYQPPTLIEVAAQGRDALHEALRQHNERSKAVEYVPPPRTERQMTALEEELAAGRRTQQRHEQQLANRPPPEPPKANDPFTTPVYRPDNMVPDPMMGKGTHGGGVYQPIRQTE